MNYYETFISVADDCPVTEAGEPAPRGDNLTAAQLHLELAGATPYAHTHAQIMFRTFLNAKGYDPSEHEQGGPLWDEFFSKGQPCLRTSALAKRYGWGFHCDAEGRVKAIPIGSDEYSRMAADGSLEQVKAMRSSRR